MGEHNTMAAEGILKRETSVPLTLPKVPNRTHSICWGWPTMKGSPCMHSRDAAALKRQASHIRTDQGDAAACKSTTQHRALPA